MSDALIPFLSALFGGAMSASASYLVSQRTFSRSGARLKADLELLEKARNLALDPIQVAAIEARVANAIKWHTESSID